MKKTLKLRSAGLLFVAVAVQTLSGAAQETGGRKLTTFGTILTRVTHRDPETQAILAVSPLPDAPECPGGLRLSMQRVAKTSEVSIELSPTGNARQVFESYRLKEDPFLARELEQLANYAKQPRAARNTAKKAPVFLRVAHQRQERNLCAPTSASMALGFYGEDLSPRRVKELAHSVTADPAFAGTYFVDLVKGLKPQGYAWQAMGYAVTDQGFAAGMARIIASLDAGEPVLVDTFVPPDGHTILVTGYDPDQRRLALLDPNIAAPGIRLVTYDEFQQQWRAAIKELRGCIFTHRKLPTLK